MQKTYKLLKYIDSDSIGLGETFEANENIKLNDGSTIPAKRLIKEGYIEEVQLENKKPQYIRPTSRESIGKVKGHYIDSDCYIRGKEIFDTNQINKQIWLDKEQAEASIALAQVTHLLQQYEIQEYSSTRFDKNSATSITQPCKRKKLIEFYTEDKIDHFYKYHKELIDKLAPFYIF